MKKSIKSAVIFSVIFGFSSLVAAKMEKADAGVYALVNNENTEQVQFRFAHKGRYWNADVLVKDQWLPVQCENGKLCNFTDSSKKTMKRLFAKHPDLIKLVDNKFKGASVSCVDVTLLAFCRINDSEKVSYFFVNDASAISPLIKQAENQ